MRISDWSSDVCSSDLVLRPDIDIVEIQRVPVFAREETRRLAERKSFGATLDENRTDTVHTWAEADVDEEHGRMETVRGEHLLAADAPAVAIGRRDGLEFGHRRTRAR